MQGRLVFWPENFGCNKNLEIVEDLAKHLMIINGGLHSLFIRGYSKSMSSKKLIFLTLPPCHTIFNIEIISPFFFFTRLRLQGRVYIFSPLIKRKCPAILFKFKNRLRLQLTLSISNTLYLEPLSISN